MSNKWSVKPYQAKVLKELEKLLGRPILQVDEIKWDTVGFKIKENNIIGLGLFNCELTILPESIGTLQSLQELNLTHNQLNTLPESIGNLQSLQTLDLFHNQLNSNLPLIALYPAYNSQDILHDYAMDKKDQPLLRTYDK